MRRISGAGCLSPAPFRAKLRPTPRAHIANTAMRVRIERACREAGYAPPAICTPNELMETGHGDDPA